MEYVLKLRRDGKAKYVKSAVGRLIYTTNFNEAQAFKEISVNIIVNRFPTLELEKVAVV